MTWRLTAALATFVALSCAEGFVGGGGRPSDDEESSAYPELSFPENPREDVAPVLSCQGAPDDDGDACTEDVCVPEVGETFHFPVVVDDKDACTLDTCDKEVGVVRTELDCDDASLCTSDGCHADVGCFHVPIVYFNETFSETERWTLEGFHVATITLEEGQDPAFGDQALHAHFDGPASMVVATTNLELHPLGGAWLRYAHTVPPAHATLRVEIYAEGQWHIVDEIAASSEPDEPPVPDAADVSWHLTTVPITVELSDDALVRFAVLVDDTGTVSGDVFIDDVKVLPAASCP